MANHCFHANLATGPKLNLLKFFSLDQNQIRGRNLAMKVLAFSKFNFKRAHPSVQFLRVVPYVQCVGG